MMHTTQALEAALRIRERSQAEVEWIDQMMEIHRTMPDVTEGQEEVVTHLELIKTLLEGQDELIAMALKVIIESDELLDDMRRFLDKI